MRNQATMLDVTKRHTLGWKGDEGERAGGRSHDEVQPRLADALGDADDALLLAAADRLHHEPDHRVGDAVGERLRDRMRVSSRRSGEGKGEARRALEPSSRPETKPVTSRSLTVRTSEPTNRQCQLGSRSCLSESGAQAHRSSGEGCRSPRRCR